MPFCKSARRTTAKKTAPKEQLKRKDKAIAHEQL